MHPFIEVYEDFIPKHTITSKEYNPLGQYTHRISIPSSTKVKKSTVWMAHCDPHCGISVNPQCGTLKKCYILVGKSTLWRKIIHTVESRVNPHCGIHTVEMKHLFTLWNPQCGLFVYWTVIYDAIDDFLDHFICPFSKNLITVDKCATQECCL